MVRQARRYLVGAVSSVTVVSIAIVLFVVLVSAQVFTDWPIAALDGGGEKSAVSAASEVSAEVESAPSAAAQPKTVNPATSRTATAGDLTAAGDDRAGGGDTRIAAPQDNTSVGSTAPPVTESEPVRSASDGGSTGSSPRSPSDSDSGSGSAPAPSQSAPASSGGGSTPASNSNSGISDGSKGSGGGASGGATESEGSKPPGKVVEEVVDPVTGGGGSTTAKVTETVNSTVDTVDETLTGGALKEAGVTGLTEEVVEGVVGPESVVGKTVDETLNAVGGLLGGKK